MSDNSLRVNQFKATLWAAADTLRGNMDPSEYKQVFLGLIFLKYISERFERKYEELKSENFGYENNKDEYTSCGIYFIPSNARWSTIMEHCDTPYIGQYIDDAIRYIERDNPELKGVLPKYYARAELDQNRLTTLMRQFDTYLDTEADSDMLSVAYEYCLAKFAEQEGRRAGEFYTPAGIVNVLVQSLDIKDGRLYDPCCGSGGMFIHAIRDIINHQGSKNDISCYGQESNPTTWKMCLMNLAIHGIEADVGKYNADSFLQDLHPGLKADYILASPPFNMSEWGAERLWGDVRWQYGTPPAGNANYAWLQHMIYHSAPEGRIGVILSNGSLTSQSGGEDQIRKNIVCADLVECIVSMPSHLFYSTAIPVCLWFINKAKKPCRKGNVLFVDARALADTSGRTKKELTADQITQISNKLRSYRDDEGYQDETGFCAAVTIQQIQENDFSLVPSRYIRISSSVLNMEECQTTLSELTQELKDVLHENHRLEWELKEALEELGYDI